MRGALFEPIGDEGRAALVERRLVDAITRGHLHPGERLPTESQLARSFGVAPVTVREALLALRDRGLVITRRGRNGGSFVAEHADAKRYTEAALRASSRLELRDLGLHYATITAACARLAVRRADPSETRHVRHRLERLPTLDCAQRRRLLDDIHLELVSLSQSARLTREQMKLHAEFSPYMHLVTDTEDGAQRQIAYLHAVIDAIESGEEDRAYQCTITLVDEVVAELIQLQAAKP